MFTAINPWYIVRTLRVAGKKYALQTGYGLYIKNSVLVNSTPETTVLWVALRTPSGHFLMQKYRKKVALSQSSGFRGISSPSRAAVFHDPPDSLSLLA